MLGRRAVSSFMFDQKGQIVIDKEEYEGDSDELMMQALDAGAEDFVEEDDSFEILTAPEDFGAVHEALEEAGIRMAAAEVTMIPQTLRGTDGREGHRQHPEDPGYAGRRRRCPERIP